MDPNFSNNNNYYDDENLLLNLNPISFDSDQNPSFPPSDELNSSNTLLNYVTQILMEESIGDNQTMFFDSLALRKTEEMLQQVISDSQAHQSLNPNSIITSKSADPSGRFESEDRNSEQSDDPRGSRRSKKNHEREILDFEEFQKRKQQATNKEEGKITEMFDKVLLLDNEFDPQILLCDEIQKLVKGEKKRHKKKKIQIVDFRTLLTLCAQAMSSGDEATARVLLLQIKEQSSPLGDAGQRLAHCLANALEARLHGNSGPMIQTFCSAITSLKTTAAETLKAYRAYLSSSPFVTLMYFYSIKMILEAAKDASVLHIIDFGILYGFQWPMFIQYISNKKDVPKKLRITGIELPQQGLRPAERIEETGRRLAEYCKRFNVPFEYNAIASDNWEKIRIDEFDIRPNEVLAVNVGLRLKYLQDETGGEENCPRDAFLNLIKTMNPNVFVHSIVNGSFNAPFFTSRFKEAVYHYSALFDMFDSTLPRDSQERIRFESEFYGREAMNVIACEEADRVERPETYRQWTVRMVRAGFRQKPVKAELVESFRKKLKRWKYHKDFVVDENSKWLLQGWKGRTLYASSCWVPSD